jgi:voltage-gated potassium channel
MTRKRIFQIIEVSEGNDRISAAYDCTMIVVIVSVFRKQRAALMAVGTLAVGYIIVSALVIFNVESDSFNSFFDAIYWATVSLTTMGYGDIYPVTALGRGITMVSAIFGIAIVALPAGIITAGYMNEIAADKAADKDEETPL